MVEEAALVVVEDDPDAVLLLKRAFRKVGLEAPLHVVTDGEAAMAYLAGEGPFGDRQAYPLPCIILLNLKLPKRSGLEVLEWMRARPQLGGIPVIVVTTSDEPRERRRAAELGAKHYDIKPIDSGSLLRLARKVQKYTQRVSDRLRERKGDGNGHGNGNGHEP